MLKARVLLAAGALLALSGCVTDDDYYDSGYYGGYGGSPSYGYSYPSYGYAYPSARYGYPAYGYSRPRLVDCELKGAPDIRTTPDDCRRIRREIEARNDREKWEERRRDEQRREWNERRERERDRAEWRERRDRDRDRAEWRERRDRDRDRADWRDRRDARRGSVMTGGCPQGMTRGTSGGCVQAGE